MSNKLDDGARGHGQGNATCATTALIWSMHGFIRYARCEIAILFEWLMAFRYRFIYINFNRIVSVYATCCNGVLRLITHTHTSHARRSRDVSMDSAWTKTGIPVLLETLADISLERFFVYQFSVFFPLLLYVRCMFAFNVQMGDGWTTQIATFFLVRTWNQLTLTVFSFHWNWMEPRVQLIFVAAATTSKAHLIKLHADSRHKHRAKCCMHKHAITKWYFIIFSSMWRFHTFLSRHGRASICYASLWCSWYAQVQHNPLI